MAAPCLPQQAATLDNARHRASVVLAGEKGPQVRFKRLRRAVTRRRNPDETK